MRIKSFFANIIRCFLTILSPKLNTSFNYWLHFKKKLNYKNPTTFAEKLNVLKLRYIKDPLVIKCADKYLVRSYVTEACSDLDIFLIPLLRTFNEPRLINFSELPDKFVLKWNFGAGMNFLCRDKSSVDEAMVIKQFSKWEKNKIWLPYSELQYKYAKKIILCESFLDELDSNDLVDYKVYCFNGEPKAILVMHDRSKDIKTEFFDIRWNKLKNSSHYIEPTTTTKKPKCLDTLLECCRRLSGPFPFVRCDFYIVDDKLYFGEMTFTPNGSIYASETIVDGKTMGELLNIK